jgi:hypothetical protein
VSPRAYRMVRVKLPLPRPRARILNAARQLLANESETDLGMEDIACRAEGSRLTFYYQVMAADVVSMLSGFETYDALAQAGHDQEAIVRTLIRLTRAVGDSA